MLKKQPSNKLFAVLERAQATVTWGVAPVTASKGETRKISRGIHEGGPRRSEIDLPIGFFPINNIIS